LLQILFKLEGFATEVVYEILKLLKGFAKYLLYSNYKSYFNYLNLYDRLIHNIFLMVIKLQ
jgi:hypothetical protein